MKTIHSHYLFLCMAVTVMLVVAVIFGYMYRSVGISLARISEARDAVEAATLTKEREAKFMQIYQASAEKWAKIREYFIPADQVVLFIEALESIGPASHSEVSLGALDIESSKKTKNSSVGYVKGKVNAEGDWSAVMRALEIAESLPYKVSVSNVRLDARKDTSSSVAGQKDAKKKQEQVWLLSFDIRAATILNNATSTKK